MNIEDFRIQFERLLRHYSQTVEGYDIINLLDLTHCLRIFCDMKEDIENLSRLNEIKLDFKISKTNKTYRKIFGDSSFIHTPISTGINTNNIEIKDIMISDQVLTPEEIKKMYELGKNKNSEINTCFTEWLGAEIVSFKYDKKYSVSREKLIRRIANMMGASHPKGFEKDEDVFDTELNKLIFEMESYKIADGYPFTYYCLIEIAKNILDSINIIQK